MNSGSDLSKPFMPTYGEATAEGIQTQLDLLRGTGRFAGSGGLLGMLPYDTAVREATAQADTDVQRRQLLGGESRTKAEAITQADIDAPGSNLSQDDLGKFGIRKQELVIDQNLSSKEKARSVLNAFKEGVSPTPAMMETLSEAYPSVGENEIEALEAIQYLGGWREDQFKSIFGEDNYNDLNSVELEGQPQYTTNFVTQNPQTGQPYQEGESEKTSEGLIDILGDKRELEGMRADYRDYVFDNPDLLAQFQEMRTAGSDVTAEEFGRKHYEEFGQAEGRELPETFGSLGRSAGYTEDGQFLGLSAFAEDVGRANISRQRTSDLNDVSRFAGQYKDIMEQFRDPNTPKTIGEIGGANDVFLNAMGGNAGATGEAGAEAGATPQPTGPGLRAMLASQATDALGQGLTERERQRIQDSFKGQATMMGRTFDQSAGIREAEALVGESNQRKMQNRAFAQSVLGQEAGLRQAEISQAKANELDPFQAILGRPGGNPLQQAQGVLGQTSAGFQPGFNYLNPSAPLGYIQNNAANEMSAFNTALGAAATRDAGLISGGAEVLSSLVPSFEIGIGKSKKGP